MRLEQKRLGERERERKGGKGATDICQVCDSDPPGESLDSVNLHFITAHLTARLLSLLDLSHLHLSPTPSLTDYGFEQWALFRGATGV